MPIQVTSLTLVRGPLEDVSARERSIPLVIDREHLAKLRWRGEAEDGREFGFDLDEPLKTALSSGATARESTAFANRQNPCWSSTR